MKRCRIGAVEPGRVERRTLGQDHDTGDGAIITGFDSGIERARLIAPEMQLLRVCGSAGTAHDGQREDEGERRVGQGHGCDLRMANEAPLLRRAGNAVT